MSKREIEKFYSLENRQSGTMIMFHDTNTLDEAYVLSKKYIESLKVADFSRWEIKMTWHPSRCTSDKNIYSIDEQGVIQ